MLSAFVSGARQRAGSDAAHDPAASARGSSAVDDECVDQFATMMGIARDAAATYLRSFRARQDRARLQDSNSPVWRSPRQQSSEEFMRAACDAWFRQLLEASDRDEAAPAADTADDSAARALNAVAAGAVALRAETGAVGGDAFARSPQHAPF